MDYRFILEPYSGIKSRFTCPNCDAKNTFSRYIDTETNQYLDDSVGRCERLDNCGYHLTPKEHFQTTGIKFDSLSFNPKPKPIKEVKPPSYIPFDLVQSSLKHYENNHFVYFLQIVFGERITEHLISEYYIGTSKYWNGSTVFWQIDKHGNVRSGKIMLYDKILGKRIKKPINHITWVHKALKLDEFNLSQCFFGEHLLQQYPFKPIAIVESEKTAIISSMYYPQFIWLATGSKQNLSFERFKALKNRTVHLFPDLKAFNDWKTKAEQFKSLAQVHVSDILERNAKKTEIENGYDLADYLLQFSYLEFVNPDIFPKSLIGDYERLKDFLKLGDNLLGKSA